MMTDEMLYRAAKQVNTAIVEHWEQHEVEEHSFSLRFERRIRRLTRKANNPQLYRFLNKAACLLLTALISFAAVMTFNVEARAAFVRWVKTIYEDQIIYEFFGEREEIDISNYRVTWVPEGYELVQEYKTDLSYTALYQQGEDIKNAFIFKCFYLTDGRKVQYLTGDQIYKYKKVNILGQKADFYQAVNEEQANSVIWINEKYNLCFAIDAYLDEEIIIKIAESIVPLENKSDYCLGYIPVGYTVKTNIQEDDYTTTIYANDDGKQLTFNYTFGSDSTKLYLCTKEHETVYTTVKEYDAYIYMPVEKDSRNDIVWIGDNDICFRISAYMNVDELREIAESIQKVK